jgi:hypothetical protein
MTWRAISARPYSLVHFTVINANVTDSLLHLMQGVYAPAVLQNKTWPESIRKEFTGQLHKFMANLTERAHEFKGKTVLYIPGEDIQDVEAAAKVGRCRLTASVPVLKAPMATSLDTITS